MINWYTKGIWEELISIKIRNSANQNRKLPHPDSVYRKPIADIICGGESAKAFFPHICNKARIFTLITPMLHQILISTISQKKVGGELVRKGHRGLHWWSSSKEFACQCRRHRFNPWSRKIPHAAEQLSSCTTTTELTCHHYWILCIESPCSATREATSVRSLCTTTRE